MAIVLFVPAIDIRDHRQRALNDFYVIQRGRQLPVRVDGQRQGLALDPGLCEHIPAIGQFRDTGFAILAFRQLETCRIFRLLALHPAEPVFP